MRPGRLFVALVAIAWVGVVGWGVAHREPDLSNPRAYPPWNPPPASGEERVWVSIEDLPDPVWQAFVAAVDPTLFERPRLGLPSTMARELAWHKRGRGQRSSGFEMMVLAWRLDAELTRMELIELFVNVVFLRPELYGIEEAARYYTGAPANQLDPAEAALIASLARYQSGGARRAHERREVVLLRMADLGWLHPTEAKAYAAEPIHWWGSTEDTSPRPSRLPIGDGSSAGGGRVRPSAEGDE